MTGRIRGAGVLAATIAMVGAGAMGVGATWSQSAAVTERQGGGLGQGGGQGRGGGRGQAQTRDNQNQPVGTSSISGTVVSMGTGGPVRRARVSLSGAELRGARATMTDDNGQFEFAALPAGRFTMTASKAGYVDITYGAKAPGRPGTPIQLAEGQKLDKANISLPRGSVVTGIVLDDSGEPSPGTQVRVMRFVMRSGERALQSAGQDQTDDRGMYRVYGLQPGDYMVSAIPRNPGLSNMGQAIASEIAAVLQQAGAGGGGRGGGAAGGGADLAALLGAGRGGNQALADRAAQLQQQLAQTEQEQAVAYAPVYYPGTASPSNATTVTLGISEERGGIDFQLPLVHTARVSGTVVSTTGALPQGTQVMLVPADRAGFPSIPGRSTNTSRVGPDGQFSFANIAPGQYSLQARAAVREEDPNAPADQTGRGGRGGRGLFGGRGGPISQILWAVSDVSVNGTDLPDLVLNLQPGMTISGRIAFTGANSGQPDFTNVRVNLQTRGAQLFEIGGNAPAQVDESGRFTITGVAPGRYAIQANVAGGGRGGGGRGGAGAAQTTPGQTSVQWVLQSSVAGGFDTLDFPLEVQPNQDVAGVIITFADRSQELSGTLQDPSGMPTADYTIVLFPADGRFWTPQSRRITSSRPGTDGRFTFRNVPPGEYRLTAITDAEPGEWFNPAFLEQLMGASIPVSIAEGEKKVQDIRVAR